MPTASVSGRDIPGLLAPNTSTSPTIGGTSPAGGPAGGPAPGEVTPPEFFDIIGRPRPEAELDFAALIAKMQADSAASLERLQLANQAQLAELQAAQDARLAELQQQAAIDKKRRETELAFRQRRGGATSPNASGSGPNASPLGDLGASLLGSGAGKTLLGQ